MDKEQQARKISPRLLVAVPKRELTKNWMKWNEHLIEEIKVWHSILDKKTSYPYF